MAGTIVTDAIRSELSTPTVFRNTSGVEIGQLSRSWANFNGVTTATIRASFNMSSITRNSTGNYTANLSNALTDANYALTMGHTNSSGGSANMKIIAASASSAPTTMTSSAVNVQFDAGSDVNVVSMNFSR